MNRVRIVFEGKVWGILPVKWTVTIPIPDPNVLQSLPIKAGPLKGMIIISQV